MRRVAVLIRLAVAFFPLVAVPLSGCGKSDTSPSGTGKNEVAGWKFASGKRPSRAEYAALVASCRQGAVRSAEGKAFEPGKPLEACLAELGLRRE